jgi:ABC-2 type transport system permease protein
VKASNRGIVKELKMKKRFLNFIIKEFRHIFRDKKTLLIIFGMPIAQLLIFGFVITNEIKDVKIAICDQSHDQLSLELTNKILSSGYFLTDIDPITISQSDEILRSGKAKLVIVFPHNFAEEFYKSGSTSVQLIADASEANSANLIVSYASAIIKTFAREKNVDSQGILPVQTVVRMLFNEELKGVFMFVPGTMALILMLLTAMMTSISIAREKELGTMEILLVSPLRPIQIIIGKVIPYVGLGFTNALLIVIMGFLVFDLPVRGSVLLLLAVCLLFIMLALSLGILISTVSNSQQVAMFLSMFALMLPTILLSGFIFPIENMPKVLQWLSFIMPPRWFIAAIKTIMLKGEGFPFIWKEVLIMSGMTIFFLGVAVKKFKEKLE